MKKYKFTIILSLINIFINHAQTTIGRGEISGTWDKNGSPYTITGDINIPYGQTLEIKPGVEARFTGTYKLNVQGRLLARGKQNDSILFTLDDTSGITNDYTKGWNGIRFDPRPVA